MRVTDSVDVRSDVWSLGMVIYEMLTGQTAFDGQSITEICAQIIEAPPRPIEVFRNDLPSGLVEVITKCLQKDVTRRYQNVAELALALMPFGPKRTRLNVERAVAVLQGAGQLSMHVQVNSTMPPSPSDFMYTPIPKAPLTPSDSFSPVPISSPSLPVGLPSGPVSSPIIATSSAYAPPPEKKKPFALILGVLAVAAIIVGALAATYKTARAPPAPAQTAETKVAPPEAKAAPPATVAATPAPPTPSEVAEPAPVVVPTTAAPVAATPHAPPRPVVVGVPRTASPRPKAPGKTGESKPVGPADEPDLGY